MGARKYFRLAFAACSAAALLFTASRASASGYLTARFGSDYGTPASPNGYAVYFNPAAMGGTKGTNLTIDASLVLRYASYDRPKEALSDPQSTDTNYIAANTGKGTLTNLLALPYLGLTSDLGTRDFRLGVAGYIPYGGLATWDRKSTEVAGVPGATDGAQRWHNISGAILAVHGTLAASYNIEPLDLSVGANVSGVLHRVSTVRARDLDNSDRTVGLDGKLAEGRSYLTATGFNVAASLGLYWAPTRLGSAVDRRLVLGLSYTSQPGFGDTRMSGTLTQVLGSGPPGGEQKIDFLQTYPDVIRFGVGYRINEKWELKSDFEYVRWSVFTQQCIVLKGKNCDVNADGGPKTPAAEADVVLNLRRDWKDAIGVRLGPAYSITPKTDVFGSLGFTTPAVPKATIDASTIDAFRIYATLGLRYQMTKSLALAGSYNHIFFLPVDTNGQSQSAVFKSPSKSPSANGVYNSQIGLLNVNAQITF